MIVFYNRLHHRWNRFYLLGSVTLSLLLPLVKIDLPLATVARSSAAVRLLNVVPTSDVPAEAVATATINRFDPFWMLIGICVLVSLAFLFFLIKSLMRIARVYRSSEKNRVGDIEVVSTSEEDAPFIFLRTVFRNIRLDIHSPVGQRIFTHEREHVRQLHTIDQLAMNVLLGVLWFNPFLWLIRRS